MNNNSPQNIEGKIERERNSSYKETVVIAGGGPAGLTAGYELLTKSKKFNVILLEKANVFGGISQTAEFNGNRIDIGGHRFFSKNNRVMEWWDNILPKKGDPEKTDDVMLTRSRLSRIYYGRKFYDYPVKLNSTTIKNLGIIKMIKAGFSYLFSMIHKVPEDNLEGFYINRFGKELYNTFFKDYTTKLWGIKPSEIDSSWGAQRIKGMSIAKVLLNAAHLSKEKETSLIDTFYYPKLGPGYLWEKVAEKIIQKGGIVKKNHEVVGITVENKKIVSVTFKDSKSQKITDVKCDQFLSTMPIPELINSLKGIKVPQEIKNIADGLIFRDFITVGILAKNFKMKTPDNWIYIQEPDVKVCRLQIFNNWSPYMVKDKNMQWVGMEYIVSDRDDIWKWSDKKMSEFGINELVKIGMIDKSEIKDVVVIHIKKAYPAYFGTYNKFEKIKKYLNQIENLYCLGRNGQHRYNNMDHSMLTAFEAVNNIILNQTDKDNVWNVNTEKEYHESK
jgi:protoporphyrinogen oxidase